MTSFVDPGLLRCGSLVTKTVTTGCDSGIPRGVTASHRVTAKRAIPRGTARHNQLPKLDLCRRPPILTRGYAAALTVWSTHSRIAPASVHTSASNQNSWEPVAVKTKRPPEPTVREQPLLRRGGCLLFHSRFRCSYVAGRSGGGAIPIQRAASSIARRTAGRRGLV